jgi:hypothetical protein
VIADVDDALRTLIRRDALNGADVEVVFDAPTKEWSARRNAPTVDVYLYDIREDLKWRAYGSVDVRNENGMISARGGPPRYFKLSYLITAWTQRPEDEHRLLSAVLYCFLRFDHLPKDILRGALAGEQNPLRLTIAIPPPEDRALSDTWSALGGELKPSLDLVVTAPVDARGLAGVAPLVVEGPRISVAGPEGQSEEARRRRRRGAGGSAEGSDGEYEPPVPEETVAGGKESQPGRVFRIRGKTEP